MGKLKILGAGKNPKEAAQARGKLFESLMAKVLRNYGYKINQILNVNYAGMEIDIEGEHAVTGVALYAECKCYENNVDAPRFQAFFGKYMAKWHEDNRSQGLFVALPGINTHARGFYNQTCAKSPTFTLKVLEEEQVLEAVLNVTGSVSPATIRTKVPPTLGSAGDWLLLSTDRGLFWVQYVIPQGAGIPTAILLFDGQGKPISDRSTSELLSNLLPELADFELLTEKDSGSRRGLRSLEEPEEIVEVRGSSEWLEYQFPASPEHFVGREEILQDFEGFVQDVLAGRTSSRGIVFLANSGWGKSSVVLAAVKRLRESGHLGVAIDSRSASTSQFILRAIDFALHQFAAARDFAELNKLVGPILGFEGGLEPILELGSILKSKGKVAVIFFDQFENLFFQPAALRRITDFLLKLSDARTNVVFGFSWKTDLVGLTTEFPYQMRDTIEQFSHVVGVETFTEMELTVFLDRFAQETGGKLNEALKFFLIEFSQGFPWLLKRLCAHVKVQRDNGVPQQSIADGLLNVEQLFLQDLKGLSTEEEDVLRRIARAAPISVSELGEDFEHEIVQSLVNRRTIVRIGNKYDVYWDIFRDYLNSGRLPIQENYILRAQLGSVLKVATILSHAAGPLCISDFETEAGLSQKSFYNIARDMRLLGILALDGTGVTLAIDSDAHADDIHETMKPHVKDRLLRNRVIQRVMKGLDQGEDLSLDQIASLLSESCPYVSANAKTWKLYGRIVADWLDFVDMAIFHRKQGTLSRYIPGTEVRERRLARAQSRKGMGVPAIQYNPVEKAAIRIVEALQRGDKRVDWSGFKPSTKEKALSTLEDLGLIVRSAKTIKPQPRIREFVLNPPDRPKIIGELARQLDAFKHFVDILEARKEEGATLRELACELRNTLGTAWTDSTTTTNAKILLNWARHSNLIPAGFKKRTKGT